MRISDWSSDVCSSDLDTIELKQSNVAEEVLRELPGVVANIGSAVNNGNGGASYVDLRGLGSTRNIVLLNGNRLAPSDVNGRVDLNNIPLALIERVDALTGAAVTTYGADAITGVVNFITKRDFAGLEVTASEQLTEQGDGNIFRVDATIGANFDDGRGNAVLSVGRSEEHTSELQSLMRISYAVFCLTKKKIRHTNAAVYKITTEKQNDR